MSNITGSVVGSPAPDSIDFRPVSEGGGRSTVIDLELQDDNNILEGNRTFFVELSWNVNCSTFQSGENSVHCDCTSQSRSFETCGCNIVLENAVVTIEDDDGRSAMCIHYNVYQYIKLDRCESVCLCVCHGCDVTSATCTLGTRL